MSNDLEMLQTVGAPSSIMMNGKLQTHQSLRQSMREITLAILDGKPDSSKISWVEERESELADIQGLIDKIADQYPFCTGGSFRGIFHDAEKLLYVKKRDLKDDWGERVKLFKFVITYLRVSKFSDNDRELTHVHYVEWEPEQPRRYGGRAAEVVLEYKYTRDHYGRWTRHLLSQTDHGILLPNDRFNRQSPEDALSLFLRGEKCWCDPSTPDRERHIFFHQSELDEIEEQERPWRQKLTST